MKCIYCLKHTTNQQHKCRSQQFQPELDKNKDKIINLINTGYATSYIANNAMELLGLNTTNSRLIAFCKRHSIVRKTIKEAARSTITRNLCKSTVSKIYGNDIINVSQAKAVKEKKIATNLSRYGVENPFQRDEVQIATKHSMIQRYGVENPVHIQNRKFHSGRFSKPHKQVSEYLSSLKIDHLNDYPGNFKKFNKDLSRMYSPIPDIYILEKNIVIEIYGDRWHMNPKFYNPTDVVQFFVGERTAVECWRYDKIRIDHLKSFGLEVMIIWESDIKHNFEIVKNQIQEKLCKN